MRSQLRNGVVTSFIPSFNLKHISTEHHKKWGFQQITETTIATGFSGKTIVKHGDLSF